MLRQRIDLQDIAARDNLALAVSKAVKGKRQRPDIARFLDALDPSLAALGRDILEGRVPRGDVRRFIIHDPKRRIITAPGFADRVLHHAILNLAEARFEKMLVDSCYACRPGKGVHAAALAVQSNLRRWPWLVKVDVDAYFPTIDHRLLRELLAGRFKGQEFLDLLGRILDAGAVAEGIGLPIGALTSQHFANAYLDLADRYLLEQDRVMAHVRYMDDIVWWTASREAAIASLADFRVFLRDRRRLQLKPGVLIGPSRRGLTYCGFRIKPGIILATSRKLTRYRAGVKRNMRAMQSGRATPSQIQRAHDGLLATLAGTQTLNFRRRLQDQYDDEEFDVGYASAWGCGSC